MKQLPDILNECLEQLARGETIDRCLQQYPEQAEELKPLLEVAQLSRIARNIKPRPEFKAQARYQFRAALESAKKKKRPALAWLPRWATVTGLIVGLLTMGGGVVAAAGYSMPDSPLYPVKLAAEQVQLDMTTSNVGKAELNMKLADRRVNEIIYMARMGEADRIEAIAEKLDDRIKTATAIIAAELSLDMTSAAAEPGPVAAMAPSATPDAEPSPDMTSAAAAPGPVAAMAPSATPAPKIASSPLPPGMSSADTRSGKEDNGPTFQAPLNEREKLKSALAQYAATHPAVLRAILENAPENSKPALRHSIAAILKTYQEALKELGD